MDIMDIITPVFSFIKNLAIAVGIYALMMTLVTVAGLGLVALTQVF